MKNTNAWSPAEMAAAIDEFERTGRPEFCLQLLGVADNRSPLLALQTGLRRAQNRRERDAFEDIAWCVSRREVGKDPEPKPNAVALLEKARKLYGRLIDRYLSEEQVRALINGLWYHGVCQPKPTEECLLAMLGLELQKAADEVITVAREDFGKELMLSDKICEGCGGSQGGRGHVVCPACLWRARSDLEADLATGRLQAKENPPDLDGLAPRYLSNHGSRYGCIECKKEPMKTCVCARELTIPRCPSDGEIVRGRVSVTGDERYFCVRLKLV